MICNQILKDYLSYCFYLKNEIYMLLRNLLLHTISFVMIYGVRLGLDRFLIRRLEHYFINLILYVSSI